MSQNLTPHLPPSNPLFLQNPTVSERNHNPEYFKPEIISQFIFSTLLFNLQPSFIEYCH